MKKTLKIEGMTCGHCTSTVEKALRAVPGVTDASVDLATKTATVIVGDEVSDAALTSAIDETGFEVTAVGV